MKKPYILIAMAMVATLTTVSCKCSSKKSQEPTREEVQQQKQALADSVLAEVDSLVDEYINAANQSFKIQYFELTEKEKLTKPDYLLEPSYANNLVSKSQKTTALAYYSVDRLVRVIYEMPTNEIDEVMAKLIAELNHPWSEYKKKDVPVSELMKKAYQTCKENGDLAYFWQFQNAILCETSYVLAQNPELFFSKITEQQWQSYYKRLHNKALAIRKLAQYDEEMSAVRQQILKNRISSSDEEYIKAINSINSSIEYFRSKQDKYIARRNALLQ